jgi:phage terminase small subunit
MRTRRSQFTPSRKRPTTKAGREAARVRPHPAAEASSCNVKELAFIDEWMLDFNGCRAMLRAGITSKRAVARVYASLYLDRPHVQLEIARRRKCSAARLEQSRERIIEELQRIALANIDDIVDWGRRGLLVRTSATLAKHHKSAIAEISETRGRAGRTLRVKMHPKIDAITQFLKQISPSSHEAGLSTGGGSTIVIEGGPTGLEVAVNPPDSE